jgi:predicted esterase
MNKIYCAGFSSGAFFCSELAQYFNYNFKGVVLNSGCNVDCIDITKTGPIFNCTTGHFISSIHPPTLIVHGLKDQLVPYECAESYYQDLESNNIVVNKLIDETGGHIWLNQYNNLIIDWLKNT